MKGRANKMRVTFILIILVFSFACTKEKKLRPSEMLRYVESEENGFISEKKIGDIKFTLKHQPVTYKAARKINSGEIKSRDELNAYVKSIAGLNYFILEIENMSAETDVIQEASSNQEEYLQRINYYSYDFERDLKYVSGTDTLKCSLFHYENSYGGTPVARFLVAFNGQAKTGDRHFVFEDKVFNKGIIKFTLEEKLFSDLPELNY